MESRVQVLSSRERLVSILNGVVLYMLAFLLVHLSVLSITQLLSESLGIEAKILYNRVIFLTEYNYQIWTIDTIVAMFFSGSFLAIIIAGIFSRLNTVNRFDRGWTKMFYLYVFFHGINFTFGSFAAGAFSKQVLWYAMAWLRISDIIMYLIGILGLVILYFLGQTKIMSVYEASIFPNPNSSFNRQEWLLNSLLKPWFFGGILVALIFSPDLLLYILFLLIFPIIMFIPSFVRSKYVSEALEIPIQQENKILWIPLIILILSFSAVRLLLVA